MPNVALVPRAGTVIEPLMAVVDGYPSANHRLETSKGGEPLEDGREATDHAVARSERLILTGWVSDFRGGNPGEAAWSTLRRLHKSVTPLRVVTELGDYSEMLITRCESREQGRGIQFRLELEEVIRVGLVENLLPPGQIGGPAEDRSGSIDRGRLTVNDDPFSFVG